MMDLFLFFWFSVSGGGGEFARAQNREDAVFGERERITKGSVDFRRGESGDRISIGGFGRGEVHAR